MHGLRVSAFALLLTTGLSLLSPVKAQPPEMAVRAELAAPLQAVQALFKEKKFAQALEALKQADAVQKKTEEEWVLIERLRSTTALNAGQPEIAIASYEKLLTAANVEPREKIVFLELLASLNFNRKAFDKTMAVANQYLVQGGSKPSVRLMLAQAAFLSGKFETTVEQTRTLVQLALDKQLPPEKSILQLQAGAQQNLKDVAGYTQTLETLLAYHPQVSFWADLLGRVQEEKGFATDQLLDLYRLQLATGSLGVPEAMEMAQLSLKQGFPIEALESLKQVQSLAQASDEKAAFQKLQQDAQAQADADAKAATAAGSKSVSKKTNAFASGYQQWLLGQREAGLANMQKAVEGDAAALNRLRLAGAYAMTGQLEAARIQWDLIAKDSKVSRLVGLWRLYANNLGRVALK